MLRRVIIGYGLLYFMGAVVLLFIVHAALWLVLYLGVNGIVLVSAVLLERKGYRTRVDRTKGPWQLTDERFVDPTTGQLMEVFYNTTSGERDYREVTGQTEIPDDQHNKEK